MEAFLKTLFGEAITPDRQLGIFTLPDKRAQHFASLEAGALHAANEAPRKDVYFGVGLAGGRFHVRNFADDIVAIPGLWADLDCVAPWRADKPLPQDIDESRKVIEALPLPPSMLVDSGHGLHAYWLFHEPWIFEPEEEDRKKAKALAKGWHGLICAKAAALGWRFENVGDLARVLRLPGTINQSKGGEPAEVRVIEEHLDRRYEPGDFEDFAVDETPASVSDSNGLTLRFDAEPPADKFVTLYSACPAFAQAWNRQRGDLQDQSQSAYDLSLADIAALNGWNDQEITNLLIAARRKHGDKPDKALRPDYLARTISSAREIAGDRVSSGVDISGLLVAAPSGPPSLKQLVRAYPELRKPVIEGLLREGETMNLISAPKMRKSWLVNDLAISIAAGTPWLGFECVQGDVLILDNELHSETSANRIPKVAKARGARLDRIDEHIFVENLRGQLRDVLTLGPYFKQFQPGQFKLVILDAFYRFMPMRTDENDNGTMATLYNQLDAYASYLKCCFVLIHHTSKGNQSGKEVTDVGAGAGAQARATDTHLILRRHEQEGVVVMDVAVRSWPPLEPRCLRWTCPVWELADDLDPKQLRQDGATKKHKTEEADEFPTWTPEMFAEAFVTTEPKSMVAILAEANEQGLNDHKVKKLVAVAEHHGLIHRWDLGRRRLGYASGPQPEEPVVEVEEQLSKRERVERLLSAEPGLSNGEVAERCGASDRYVRDIRRELEEAGGEE
ncbi:MAG: AAA family ATPase [Gemmataceae bacterium]